MKAFIFSRSNMFNRFADNALPTDTLICTESHLENIIEGVGQTGLVIIHLQSMGEASNKILEQLSQNQNIQVAVASDNPSLDEFLNVSRWDINAYFHSYMADLHYQQMYQMLCLGMGWFHPETIHGLIGLARKQGVDNSASPLLNKLSRREREIALLVCDGLSNLAIADRCSISERTVKAHLSHIFQKLEITDRLALALAINRRV